MEMILSQGIDITNTDNQIEINFNNTTDNYYQFYSDNEYEYWTQYGFDAAIDSNNAIISDPFSMCNLNIILQKH